MTPDRFGELRSILANPPTAENIKALRILISNASAEAAPTGIFKHLDTWCMSSPMFNYIVHHFAHSSEWRRAYPWAVGDRPSTLVSAHEALKRRDLRRSRNPTGVGQGGECILGVPDEGYRGRDCASFATALLGAEVGQVWYGGYAADGVDALIWSHTAPLILAMDPQAAGLVQLIAEQIAICSKIKGGRPRGGQAQESWELIDAALDIYEEMKRLDGPDDYLSIIHPPDGGPWLAFMMKAIAIRAGSINGLILAAWFKGLKDHPEHRTLAIPFDMQGDVARAAAKLYGDAIVADIHDAIGTIWVNHWQDRLAA